MQTTEVTRKDRHNQNVSTRMGSTRSYGGARYSATRSYATRQAGRVTTAAHAITATIMETAPGTTMAVDLTPVTATTRVGRTRTGVTAYRWDITLTRTGAAIRTVVTTTTTRTTRPRTAVTHRCLQLCSGVLANSVTTTA